MKTCPYCKEEIKEEAIKCRYCHTVLISAQEDKKIDDHNVTYIVDKSIIHYGKFALAVLGIFIVVGLVLFGLDIEKTVDNMESAEKEIDDLNEEMKEAAKELELALDELTEAKAIARKLKDEIEPLRIEANYILEKLKVFHKEGHDIMAGLKELTPQEKQRRKEKIENNPELARGWDDSDKISIGNQKLWKPGQTIRIRFLDGDAGTQAKVERIAKEWTKYANIKFEFVSDPDAEVRISLVDIGGGWSYIGTDSLGIPSNRPTMILGALQSGLSEQLYSYIVLHNFGHMLGLNEEHINPKAEIPWNEEAVIDYYTSPPFNWHRSRVTFGILGKGNNHYPGYREFDIDSIMMDPIDNSLTEGDFEIGQNKGQLSNSDKEYIATLYP